MAEIKNFYELIPKEYLQPEIMYSNYDKVQIKLPMRMLVCGCSGSMKTNTVMNIIDQINAFDRFYIFAADLTEPLYKFLMDKISLIAKRNHIKGMLTASNDIEELPEANDFDPKFSNLVIIDDMITEKDKKLKAVKDIFVRGRKKNISIIFISQDYFKIPIIVRKNSPYLILKKLETEDDAKRVLKQYKSSKITLDQLMNIYRYCVSGGEKNFMLIDNQASKLSLRYRKNFDPIPQLDALENQQEE